MGMIKKVLLAMIASLLITNSAQAQNIEDAVQWAIDIANDQMHGYSQGAQNATDWRPYTGSREGVDYDCSSLIYHALDYAGFPVIENWRKNPEYMRRYNGTQLTGDADTLWQDLGALWQKFTWEEVKDDLQRGDILCAPQRHIAFYIGDGLTVEARGVNNPKGGSYATGDQGGEIDFYSAFNRGWTEVYRIGN